MNLDKFGLPCQADGDRNDQLQRCGMIVTALEMGGGRGFESLAFQERLEQAISNELQVSPGVYTRYIGGNPDNVSADQLIGALAAHVVCGNTKQIGYMALAMARRAGFAQNKKDGLNADTKTKTPDFMLLRALPLFARMHWGMYPIAVIVDILLILAALAAVGPVFPDGSLIPHKRGPDSVDHNNTILTLAACSYRMATPLSWLARKLFTRFCPWNYGCCESYKVDYGMFKSGFPVIVSPHKYHPVYGSLRWYHRKESGGNPEIAELWAPICKELFE